MQEQIKIQENNEPSQELIKKISTFYEQTYKGDVEDGFMDKSKIESRIQGEISFYKSVLESLNKAKSENPNKTTVALFDIDDTLGTAQINEENGFDHILRPSVFELLSKIKEKNIDIGFLTSRKGLEEQLENELKDLKSFINKEYLFSTRDLIVPPSEEDKMKDVLFEEMKSSFSSGDFNKMKFLNELISDQKNKNKVFIPIDDFKYPALYSYGVALKDKEKFFI